MRKILLAKAILILLFSHYSLADIGTKQPRKIIVAVIDTGLDSSLMKNNNNICEDGHKDFTGYGLQDTNKVGHGTHVSSIIDQYVKDYIFSDVAKLTSYDLRKINDIKVDYCQIIIKIFDPRLKDNVQADNSAKALRWAIDHNVDIINYSGGGVAYDYKERKVVIEALNKGIKIVAAAGNESSNIDKVPFYPAAYDKRIFAVGNLTDSKTRKAAKSSNYGKSVNTWEVGTNVFAKLPSGKYGYLTGTSQATAVKTGKLIRKMLNHK